ncbi:uncharacterized protein RHO17_004310 isoform 2-T2 [Thomomys bottae]
MTPASAASDSGMPAVEEANLENNMEPINFPLVNENDQYPSLADTLPSDSDVQGVAEASLGSNPEEMNFSSVTEHDGDTIPSDSDSEDTIVIEITEDAEVNGQAANDPRDFGHFHHSGSENAFSSESTIFQDTTAVGASVAISSELMNIPSVVINDNGIEEVVLLRMPRKIQVGGKVVYYSAVLGHKTVANSEAASASSNVESPVLVVDEPSLESNSELMNFPPVVENYNDHSFSLLSPAKQPPDSDIVKVILIKMPRRVKVNGQIVISPGLLGRIITSDSETESTSESSYVGFEKLILEEIPFDPETMDQNNSEIVNDSLELGNDSDYDDDDEEVNECPFFSIPMYFDDQEVTPIRMNCPVSMENGRGQDNIPAFPLITGFAYLGDPRRNIRIHSIHLMTTEKMTKPSLAACYLVYVLFSEETLIDSSASISSLGYPDLDPNRMAAIREHLASIFLQCDLTEDGNDWSICLSSIKRLVENLCIEVQTHLREVALVYSDRNDGGEGSNQESCGRLLYGRRVLYGARNGKPVTCYVEQLGHLGHSSRHVQVPCSVMTIAKTKRSPELSARFLSHYLFTEELSKTTTVDNMRFDSFSRKTFLPGI